MEPQEIQVKKNTRDKAFELYMQMRSQKIQEGTTLTPNLETELMSAAIHYADKFNQMFYDYYSSNNHKQ